MTITQVVRRFWPDLRPLRWWLLLLVVLLAGAPLIAVLEVLLFQRLVDDVLVPATLQPLVWIAALYVGLNLLSAVISGVDDYLSTWISQKFLVRLRTKVFGHVLAHPSHVHDRNRLGDTMSRLTSDTAAVESFMIGQFATGTGAVLRLRDLRRRAVLAAVAAGPGLDGRRAAAVVGGHALLPAGQGRLPRAPPPGRLAQRGHRGAAVQRRARADLQPRGRRRRGLPPSRTSPSPRPSWSAPGSARCSCRWPTWPSWSAPWP